MCHVSTTSAPRVYDVCTTSRFGSALKTSLERVHGRYWIRVFQVLLQFPERLENHTKTSYLCNTFCEYTRLRDVFSVSQQENVTVRSSRRLCHICTTSVRRPYHVCTTSVSCLYDVCTTSRFGGVLKTSLERVHGRFWIRVFQVLLQFPERLENHTKTSYLCNTFCESTRLRDVLSVSQQENVTVRSSRRLCHICTTSVRRPYHVCTTSVSCLYDVCTTSRFGGVLKTSLERVHGRYWIRVFQVLLQFPERLENHTKTSYLCNTFCESTRLRDVFSVSQQENVTVRSSRRLCHICTTSVRRPYHVCTTSVSCLYDVCTTSRFGGVLKTSLERVHGRYWIRVFQVLLQFPERLENHTKTSYLCNTFCESTRLRDVFSVSQQENVTVRSSRRLCHICTTSVRRPYHVCTTSVSCLYDVCTTSRFGGVLKTSLERVHGRYWIRVFQVLLQFPERLENYTKTSYLCNTFCESTRLRDVFTWS